MPADILFRGDFTEATQVTSATPTADNNAVYTLTMNGKVVTFTADGSATVAEIVTGLAAAWLASTDPEFAEVTPSDQTTYLKLTAVNPAKTFTVTGGATGAGTLVIASVTASTGPNHVDVAGNWSGGAQPGGGDSVYFTDLDVDAKHKLETYAAVAFTKLNVLASYVGKLGLPRLNEDGDLYVEYRQRYFQTTTLTLNVGAGDGNGSGLIYLDSLAANNVILTVYKTGSPVDSDLPSLVWKGTGSGNKVHVFDGSVGLGLFPGETATITTLNVEGGTVLHRNGAIVGANLLGGGSVTFDGSTITTLTVKGSGTATVFGAGGCGTIQMWAGTVKYNAPVNITTVRVRAGCVLDFSDLHTAIVITNLTKDYGGVIKDPNGMVTVTNGVIHNGRLTTSDGDDWGMGRTMTLS
jgi:hypothetical protein